MGEGYICVVIGDRYICTERKYLYFPQFFYKPKIVLKTNINRNKSGELHGFRAKSGASLLK